MEDNTPLEKQIETLADYLLTNFPFEIGRYGQSEGAVEVAIRLLKEYQPLHTDHQRKVKELTNLILKAVNSES